MTILRRYIFKVLLIILTATSYRISSHELDERLNPVETATLYRVEDGVFHLHLGGTVDLTDRKVLMSLREGKKCLEISLSGRSSCIAAGDHYDLTFSGNPFRLGKLFNDKARCILDVVDVTAPKGAQPKATFRLYCL